MRHQARIEELRDQIVQMGQLSLEMVKETLSATLDSENPKSLHDEIMKKEGMLDQLQLDLDKEAVAIITMFNPVAHNLRFLLTATRVTSELERIGDQAVNICTYARISRPSESTLTATREMGRLVVDMVEAAIQSFENADPETALETILLDDQLDQYDRDITTFLLNDPAPLPDRTTALLVSQALERMGDQATNICEDVIYAVNGDDVRHCPAVNLLDTYGSDASVDVTTPRSPR